MFIIDFTLSFLAHFAAQLNGGEGFQHINKCRYRAGLERDGRAGLQHLHRAAGRRGRSKRHYSRVHLLPAAVTCDRSDQWRSRCSRAVGLSCLTLIIGRFSRDYRELRFKNTIIPLPYAAV